MTELTGDRLVEGLDDLSEESAITIHTTWEPIAGSGAPVKPAIYAGGRYQFGERWWDDGTGARRTLTVSLDSVPSQANRLEAALRGLRNRLGLPELIVDLSSVSTLPSHLPTTLSSFEFPHRNADAYLRDAELDGTAFLKTDVGKEIFGASGDNPNGLLHWMPQALLYGFWQSHLGKKRLQTKWPRVWTAELFGIEPATDPDDLRRTLGTKGDPLNLTVDEPLIYDENDTLEWQVGDQAKAKKATSGKRQDALSNLGHGQVPFKESESAPTAVSCRSIQQLATVSFAGLRRLDTSPEARAMLVALALVAHQTAFGRGVHLRSGCELRPVSTNWIWLAATDEPLTVPSADALCTMFEDLAQRAADKGAPTGPNWPDEALILTPKPSLKKVIEKTWPLEPIA